MKFFQFNLKHSQTIADDEAKRLTEAFLNGSTTAEEEHKLYRYYASAKVAEELQCYTQMFAWYASMEQGSEVKARRSSRSFAIAAAVTAFVLVGIGLSIGAASDSGELSVDRMYAGSYIIRDGKKITDIKEILPELQKADRFVDSALIASVVTYPDNADVLLLNEAVKNITDPDVRAILLADLN